MKHDKDQFERNRPADERSNNDPYIREESGQQPGINTYSSSDTDDDSENITKTASDNFDINSDFGKGADTRFDEIDNEDE